MAGTVRRTAEGTGTGLRAPDCVPHAVDSNIVFIAVEPRGHARVTIGYRPLWRPLAPNFDGRQHH